MLSRISIDLDQDNQPIIRIDYRASDDVRDKMVKRFMETFAGESWFATFHFINNPVDQDNTQAALRPIAPKDMARHFQDYKAFIENQKSEL